jgi:photosystem II stability/assembly factor-like uncharacterized protein
MKTIIVLVALAAFGCLSSLHAQPLWEQTNGPGGSLITGINFDSAGGVYILSNRTLRSSDNGLTWTDLHVSYSEMKTLPNGDLFTANQISKDLGQTWRTISSTYGPSAITISGEIYLASIDRGHVLRTSDEGTTWDTLAPPPTKNGKLYSFNTSTIFWLSDYLYRSTNRGLSWSKVVNGWKGSGFQTEAVLSGGKEGRLVYEDGSVLSTSYDDGRTWSAVEEIYAHQQIAITIDKRNRIVIANDMGVGRYDSMGRSLNSLSVPFAQGENSDRIYYRILATSPKGEVWYVHGSNLFRSDVNLSKFSYVSVPTGIVNALVAQGPTLIGSSGDRFNDRSGYWIGMLYQTKDRGNTWSGMPNTSGEFSPGNDYYNNSALSNFSIDSTHAILASKVGTVVKSVDKGLTWNGLGSKLSPAINSITVDPIGYIFVGTLEGVFRSTDHGATWDQLNYGLSNTNILSLSVNSAGDVFAGTSNRIFRTTDHALTWQTLQFTPPDTSGITSMVVNTDGDVLAAVKSSGIYWSHDNGNSWGQIGAGLKGKVNAMLSTPIGHVFAATDQGVYYLEVGGGAWVDANAGLTSLNVLSITRDPAGTVYLGTDGAGVFRSTQTYNIIQHQQAVHRMPSESNDLALNPVYPNPITSSATLAFSIPASSVVRVELLNALGETVKLLANENLVAGGYTVPVDASELANGVYHVRLITSAGVKMQNIVVAR